MVLEFNLGRIPIRIHLWFLLFALLLGLGAQRNAAHVAIWAAGFLVTALAHELGHAVAARSFGVAAEVNLTLLRAGLGARLDSLPSGRRAVVCLAGPAASLGVAATAFAVACARFTDGHGIGSAVLYLGWINLGWGLVNLLPVLPLDAGNALVALLDGARRGHGEEAVRWLSITLAAVIGVASTPYRLPFPALLCAFVAFQNALALRRARATNREALARAQLQAAFGALERDDAITASDHCRAVLGASTDRTSRKDAVRMLAYAYASTGMWGEFMDLLESGATALLEDEELRKYEQATHELGRPEDGRRIAWLRARVGRPDERSSRA
jgi:stage IV sporulation protein FB